MSADDVSTVIRLDENCFELVNYITLAARHGLRLEGRELMTMINRNQQ
jgi:hypothetical protein